MTPGLDGPGEHRVWRVCGVKRRGNGGGSWFDAESRRRRPS